MPIAGNLSAFKAGLGGGWYVGTPERGKRDIMQILAVSVQVCLSARWLFFLSVHGGKRLN